MPLGIRFKGKIGQVVGHVIRIAILPGLAVDRRCHERPDIVAAAQDILAGFDTHFHAVHPHLAASRTGMDFGVDSDSGEHGIKRTRRRIGHEGIVEGLVVAVAGLVMDMVVLLMDLRSLRKTSLLLMDRLDDHDTRIVFMQIEEQRRVVLEHGNELFIADPGRIKEDVVAEMTDAVDDIAGIVQRPVISAELDDSQAERPLGLGFFRIPFGCQLAQIRFIETVGVDAADEAIGIAGRFQIDRRRPGLDESPESDGLVIVAVIENQVARRQQGIGDDLIGRRRAIEDEIGLIGMEDFGCKILRFQSRPFVDEQITEGHVGITDIGLKNMRSIEIIKIASCRMLLEKQAVLMARAVKRRILFTDVIDEVGKKRRQHSMFIAAGQAFGRRNTAALIDHFFRKDDIDLVDILVRHLLAARHDDHDGNTESRFIDLVDVGKILVRNNRYGHIGEIRLLNRHDFPVAVNEIILYIKAVSYLQMFHMSSLPILFLCIDILINTALLYAIPP